MCTSIDDNAIVNEIADFVEKTYLEISKQYEIIESLKQGLLVNHYQTLLQGIYDHKPSEIIGNVSRIKEMTSFKATNVYLFKFFHYSRYTDIIFANMPSKLKDVHGWQMREIRLHKEIIAKVLLCLSSLTLHDVKRLRQDFLKDGECVNLVYGNGGDFEEKFVVLFPQKQKTWSTGYCVASSDRHGLKTVKNSPKLDGTVGFYFFEGRDDDCNSSTISSVKLSVASTCDHLLRTSSSDHDAESSIQTVREEKSLMMVKQGGDAFDDITNITISDVSSQLASPDHITSITEHDQKQWALMENAFVRERQQRLEAEKQQMREREEKMRERQQRLEAEREVEILRKALATGK
jgi:hypothetical protein